MSRNTREPTRAQLSSRLQYAAPSTPAFLQRLKDRVAGVTSSDYDDDEFDQWEATSGREPIPRRPREERGGSGADEETDEFGRARRPSPSAPSGTGDGQRAEGAGSDREDGDDDDEAPQIVVLKEGKHLTGREVENERRKARGLSPLPESSTSSSAVAAPIEKKLNAKDTKPSLSFSSAGAGTKSKKRKLGLLSQPDSGGTTESAVEDLDDLVRRKKNAMGKKDAIAKKQAEPGSKPKKTGTKDGKADKKKAKTGALLSFGDEG